ncbi:MAG: transporter [Verrucomicrobia bacterium]|nr:transporter [Verrucomicrobiota bacterium]
MSGLALITVPLAAEEPVDKSGYTLFRPVPRELMRPMSLDRPDKTESPYTVDAGHYQLEMDLVSGFWDRESGPAGDVTTSGFAVAPMNWKAGLVNHVDFQWILQPYNRLRVDDPEAGPPTTRSGLGEMLTRLKINLWGDDGGPTALAVMPYIAWPTAHEDLGTDHVAGGIVLPFAAELPAGFGLGMMAQADFQKTSNGDGFATVFIQTITLGRDLFGPVAGFVEFYGEVSTEEGIPWVGTFDFGLTWTFAEDWILDAGLNVGVTRSAPDLNPFAGLSHRF